METPDWTKLTVDPVDEVVRSNVVGYLNRIRKGLPNNDYNVYLESKVLGKDVLDIGICEHTQERIDSPNWKHNVIRKHSKFSLGIDIIENLVEKLQDKGVNVAHCDATSDKYLGRKFDVVHAGDVIEHVNSPVALLNFCSRHLEDNGTIIVRTPNPYCFNYVHLHGVFGTDKSNLEHVYYICPIHALEIGRRCDLNLTDYYTLRAGKFTLRGIYTAIRHFLNFDFRHCFAELFAQDEVYSTIFVYEFKKKL
ncbi:class I SAM-dependent methyltransferase [Terasakiella pusilla]|uniref:class I SAM-dependent methyltransferase n=1 Tax=Terasakiella pusilla TaxID=64973 RepID=UPI003AA868CD